MKFESQLKSGLFAALFLLASIPAIAELQLPSQTLEEIKQSLIYQGMNEKGYFAEFQAIADCGPISTFRTDWLYNSAN